jgi:predicted enzyme related to lactoylglutathione lyase
MRERTAVTRRYTRWTAGTPCWADLTSSDLPAARAFYAAVFGWTYHDEEENGHVIARTDGADAAGLGGAPEGGASAWTVYLASDNANATASAVTAHGGTVLFPPADVGALGRGFAAADPGGAVFGVWDAREHIGAAAVGEPATVSWTELLAPVPGLARAFYAGVFGHTTVGDCDHIDESLFGLPGEEGPFGVLRKSDEAAGSWSVFFGTSGVKATVDAAERNGGTLAVPPADTPRGCAARLVDPAGASFWVVGPA